MNVILTSVLISSTYGYVLPKLCRCRSCLHVSVGSEQNDSKLPPRFTTTSNIFNESKLFLNTHSDERILEQKIEVAHSAVGNQYAVSTFPSTPATTVEENELPQSSSILGRAKNHIDERKASIATLSFVSNVIDKKSDTILDLEEDINEAAQKINEVNFQLDEIAKDVASIFDCERHIVCDQKITSHIEKVVTEALNGYENSDRITRFCESLSDCRLSITKFTDIEHSSDQTMTDTFRELDSKDEIKEVQEKVDDIVSSISDELKMQIHIELFREKKVMDLITAVERSIENKAFDIADQQKYMVGNGDIASEKKVSLMKAIITCDHELLVSLTDFNICMKNTYEKTCRRRRKLENSLQKIQSVEWSDAAGIEFVLTEISILEDALQKATKEIESECRAIYTLKDQIEDDLSKKISELNRYGVTVKDESKL